MTPGSTRSTTPSGTWEWREALAVVVGTWFVLLVGGSVVLSLGPWTAGDDLPLSAQFLATVPFWVAGVAGVVWLSRRDPDPRGALGLAIRPTDVAVGAAVGVVAQLGVLPVLYWPILQLAGLDYDDVEGPARRLADTARDGGTVGVVLFVVMACIAAPLVEELLYRGLFLRSAGWGAPVALAVTSLVFALSHLQALQLPGLLVFGLAAGLLAQRTGRIGPAFVAHVAFNATSVVGLLLRR